MVFAPAPLKKGSTAPTEVQVEEVLWIDKDTYYLPNYPDGFPFVVQGLMDWRKTDDEHVFVRGCQIHAVTGHAVQHRNLRVKVDQLRAVDTAAVKVGPPPGFARVV